MEGIRKDYNVASKTNPKKLAASICIVYRNSKEPINIILNFVGAGALNNAVKSVIIANQTLSSLGKKIKCVPNFNTIDDELNFTGMQLSLELTKI